MTVSIKWDETYSYPFPYKRLSVRITAFLRFTVICFWIVQMEVIGISKFPVSHQNFPFSFQILMLMHGMSPAGNSMETRRARAPPTQHKVDVHYAWAKMVFWGPLRTIPSSDQGSCSSQIKDSCKTEDQLQFFFLILCCFSTQLPTFSK